VAHAPSWAQNVPVTARSQRQLSVMRTPIALAILAEWSSDMQRRRFKDIMSFPDDLTEEAERLRAEAEKLPPGMERHDLERKARQAETAAHIDEWLESPGLRPPE
jgi:hypothetical protein